ncbi:MAG TPA: hypothetical protein VE569_12035 [Acidimicrobiia bacterium]|nr:hypothetical protein [Acidimicrobiia bacterium]
MTSEVLSETVVTAEFFDELLGSLDEPGESVATLARAAGPRCP